MNQFGKSGRDNTQVGRDYNQRFFEFSLLKQGFPKNSSDEYDLYVDRWNSLDPERQLDIFYFVLRDIKRRYEKLDKWKSSLFSIFAWTLVSPLLAAVMITFVLTFVNVSVSKTSILHINDLNINTEYFQIKANETTANIIIVLKKINTVLVGWANSQAHNNTDTNFWTGKKYTQEEILGQRVALILMVLILMSMTINCMFRSLFMRISTMLTGILTIFLVSDLESRKKTARILFTLMSNEQRSLIRTQLGNYEDSQDPTSYKFNEEIYQFLDNP